MDLTLILKVFIAPLVDYRHPDGVGQRVGAAGFNR